MDLVNKDYVLIKSELIFPQHCITLGNIKQIILAFKKMDE